MGIGTGRRAAAGLLALALACGAAPARAADELATATLREALHAMPAEVMAVRRGITASFVDVPNAVAASGGDAAAALFRARTVAPVRTLDDMDVRDLDGWARAAGVDARTFRYIAGFGLPPLAVDLWGLRRTEDGSAIAARLPGLGFTPVAGAPEGWTLLANGEDGHLNFAKRTVNDPWTGPLGKTSVVAIRGGLLLRGDSRGTVRGSAAATRSLADLPAVDTALAGLDGALGGLPLVNVLVLSGAAGDPSPAGDGSPAGAGTAAPPGSRLPPFLLALSADALRAGDGRGGSAAAIEVLAYPDCATARRAADLLAAAGAASIPKGARIDTRTLDNGAKGCAASLVVTQDPARP